jgi:tol-pal system protein YbgF
MNPKLPHFLLRGRGGDTISCMVKGLLALALATSCAGADGQTGARFERQLDEMRRQRDEDRHALHELENRIFLLEDKLDTAEVARGKTAGIEPRLPVVTKHKPAEPPRPAPAPDRDDGPIATEPPEPAPAAPPPDDGSADGPPVVIRMDSGVERIGARTSRRRERPAPPDLAAVSEKLPVVPLPRETAPGEDPLTAYRTAREALGRREHAAAIAGFRHFLERWPSHDYADNAQYWLGEAYYDQADYRTALVEFRAVIARYPNGNKAPDALLKVGFCLAKLGDASGAGDVLAQVVQIYPKTDAAKLATKRLEALR